MSTRGGKVRGAIRRRRAPAVRPTRHARRPQEDDVEVRAEDQKAINTFGRLNNRKHDIEEDIKEKQAKFDLLDDAANEIILADDDEPIRCAPRALRRPARRTPSRGLRAQSIVRSHARRRNMRSHARRRACRRQVHVWGVLL